MPKPIGSGKKPVAPAPSPPVGAIVGSKEADYIATDSPDKTLQTTEFDDVVWAYAGDDIIFADGGNDTIEAGLGNDFIDGGADDDIINADAGDDWIVGGDGNDTINAGDGADQIIGGNGSDTIDGGAGNDTLTYYGILGIDYYETNIYGKGKNKDVVVGKEVYKVASDETDTVTNVETISYIYPSDPVPVPGSVIDFDGMVDFLNGNLLFYETADTIYVLAQQTSGTGVAGTSAEYRDISAEGNYNYDTEDDDLEWRVWTDPDGTTHELNIAREDFLDFNIATVKFTGFEADDEVTIAYSIAPGQPNEGSVYEEHTVTFADLEDGTYTFEGGTGIGQLNIIAAAGDEVFVDDIVIG